MEFIFELFSFLGRWLHVMAGIAWIGASFYFNWFDLSVRPAKEKVLKENNRGTLNEIHGGSFYYHEQYWPDKHPERLLVHSWPAKTTFYTGLLLMFFTYWLNASVYLVDKRVLDISAATAVIISIGSIIAGWAIYFSLSKLCKKDKHLFIVMSFFVMISAYIFTHVFSGRGAFISMGAMLGSCMGLNVIFNIVPNHIAMRRQLNNGEKLNTHYGYLAKRYSQHNNYFTIPFVFCMISNHFAAAYSNTFSWIILSLFLFSGWAIRHTLNVHYKYEKKMLPLGISATLAMTIAFILCAPASEAIYLSLTKKQSNNIETTENLPKALITDERAMQIVQERCTVCHASPPTFPGFKSPPQGLILENKEQVFQNRQRFIQQVFITKNMPIGNVTKLTDDERKILEEWLK